MSAGYVILAGWVAGFLLLWRVPTLRGAASSARTAANAVAANATESLADPSAATAADLPADGGTIRTSISVIIPARNEADNLPELLGALAGQRRTPEEIIVVDDHSDDGTAGIARSHSGVTVVQAPPLPDGWTGKNWACWTGAERARCELLVFFDADVSLEPEALDALVAVHAERGGLVSVQPHHVVRRPYEWSSIVFNIMAIMGVGMATIRPTRTPRAAFGPCMVLTASDYRRLDGHRSVAHEVIEDLALGERAAEAGRPVTLLGGGDLMRYRMYPDGLRSLLQGWTKNFASGATRVAPLRTALAVLWVTAAVSSVQYGWAAATDGASWLPAVLVTAAFVAQMAVLSRRVGTFPPVSWLLYPMWFLLFVGVFVVSLGSTYILREVSWRGRTIPLPSRHGSTATPPGV